MRTEATTRMPVTITLLSGFAAGLWIPVVLVFSVLLSITAGAEVVYTSANILIPTGGSHPIDLNGDGVPDFMVESSVGAVWCQWGDGGYWKLSVESAETYSAIIAAGQNASALVGGAPIDDGQSFSGGRLLMAYLSFGSCGKIVLGNWFNIPDRYLGLEFRIPGRGVVETHYGWAKVSATAYIDQQGNLQSSTFLAGFAYETVAGKSIAAGQMTDLE
jgi:hypothetical protein